MFKPSIGNMHCIGGRGVTYPSVGMMGLCAKDHPYNRVIDYNNILVYTEYLTGVNPAPTPPHPHLQPLTPQLYVTKYGLIFQSDDISALICMMVDICNDYLFEL